MKNTTFKNGVQIEQVKSVKYLGIIVNNHLAWSDYIIVVDGTIFFMLRNF